MSYWKAKVAPKIQKVFGIDVAKKAAAVEACKSFDESKEEVSKEFEEKKAELQPKVQEIYEASSSEIKTLVKDPKDAGLKKHSAKVQKLLNELAIIEFPGSIPVSEACSKFGAAKFSGPVIFIFEKVSTIVLTEEKPREVEVPATQGETTITQESSETAEKGVVVAEEKVGEVATEVAPTTETVAPSMEEALKEEKQPAKPE